MLENDQRYYEHVWQPNIAIRLIAGHVDQSWFQLKIVLVTINRMDDNATAVVD